MATRKFETDNAIERLEIDQAIFFMAFMSQPSAQKQKELSDMACKKLEKLGDGREVSKEY